MSAHTLSKIRLVVSLLCVKFHHTKETRWCLFSFFMSELNRKGVNSQPDCNLLVESHGEAEEAVDHVGVVIELLVDHQRQNAHLGSTTVVQLLSASSLLLLRGVHEAEVRNAEVSGGGALHLLPHLELPVSYGDEELE